MPTVIVMNGPNLNLLGTREPTHYGSSTLDDVEKLCRAVGDDLALDIDFLQSNHEGVLIDRIHAAGADWRSGSLLGAVFNPGAYAHTSIALRDAIKGAELPVIEMHVSNVHRREAFRHHSYISSVATGVIVGLGVKGYELAIRSLADQGEQP
ncbi:type II 3-dehydroquinate dehydratase [Mycolicibacterium flavescens]|uniref:3-dehydroquinate dehydratase n=1 Tax=Mycolicibacterium flavescens TaxID=1776 RepID=A0A1E3RI12_MYCFV|nr:type II 3-dehydroquinate dehydratase [Mycolicibacterium flavescens]MCV7282234.1 type II 3-dehydroquinate dehydratase [Mycolicibacterium flavescens]ODQ89516.1 type II 3-dehydroquinate dehydratase [Mycolicibacterium flavescens]